MNLRNASGLVGLGENSWAASFSFTFGESKTLTTSLLIKLTTFAGVPAGANRPSHVSASKPGIPDSDSVGNSGQSFDLVWPVTASAFAWPLFEIANAVAAMSNCMSI